MKLTEKTELMIEDSYFHYTINDIIEPVRQQILENHDIISNLGVNPRELLKEWKEKSEKWDKYYDTRSFMTLEERNELEQENKQLKEIALKSIPFLERIGGAIHLSEAFEKIIKGNK